MHPVNPDRDQWLDFFPAKDMRVRSAHRVIGGVKMCPSMPVDELSKAAAAICAQADLDGELSYQGQSTYYSEGEFFPVAENMRLQYNVNTRTYETVLAHVPPRPARVPLRARLVPVRPPSHTRSTSPPSRLSVGWEPAVCLDFRSRQRAHRTTGDQRLRRTA